MAKRNTKKSKPPTTQSPNQTDRIKTAHNNFFEYIFSDLNHAREFLAVYGPSEVIGNLILDDLDFQKDDFIDEHLRQNRTDVFYEAPIATTQSSAPAHIYILFEHKSTSEADVLEQVLRYMSERWLLKYIYDESLNERVKDIFEPLTSTNLPRGQLLAHLEAMLTYTTAIKNRVPDEVLDETMNELFVEENVSFMSIKDHWIEKGATVGFEKGKMEGKLEGKVEGKAEGKIEGKAEGKVEEKRETIIRILNHISPLDETDATMITKSLAKIHDLKSLDTLVDAALDSHRTGFGKFMIQLITVMDEYTPS